jgi:exodeoxyribonuclease VII small subunit
MPKKNSPSTEITFEQALKELESIIAQLESGELPLDESLKLFERGQTLAAQCAKLLAAAELKVKQLTLDGDLEDFDVEQRSDDD